MNNKKKQTIETYDKSAKEIAAKFNKLGARIEDIERLFSFIDKEDPFIFEIGCGNGRDAKEILERTNDYKGIDISKSFIDIAKKYAPKGVFEVADVETYSFPQDVDAIVSFASLLHSNKDAVKDILIKACEALVSGGVFYISLKEGEYSEEGFTRTDQFGTRTYYFYTPELIASTAGNDYTVVLSDRQNLRGQDWFTVVLKKK